jgi:hypothetical protein
MSAVRIDGPRVHCINRLPSVASEKEDDILELILQELGIGCAEQTKRRYRTHCLNPDKMTRTTVIAHWTLFVVNSSNRACVIIVYGWKRSDDLFELLRIVQDKNSNSSP